MISDLVMVNPSVYKMQAYQAEGNLEIKQDNCMPKNLEIKQQGWLEVFNGKPCVTSFAYSHKQFMNL